MNYKDLYKNTKNKYLEQINRLSSQFGGVQNDNNNDNDNDDNDDLPLYPPPMIRHRPSRDDIISSFAIRARDFHQHANLIWRDLNQYLSREGEEEIDENTFREYIVRMNQLRNYYRQLRDNHQLRNNRQLRNN